MSETELQAPEIESQASKTKLQESRMTVFYNWLHSIDGIVHFHKNIKTRVAEIVNMIKSNNKRKLETFFDGLGAFQDLRKITSNTDVTIRNLEFNVSEMFRVFFTSSLSDLDITYPGHYQKLCDVLYFCVIVPLRSILKSTHDKLSAKPQIQERLTNLLNLLQFDSNKLWRYVYYDSNKYDEKYNSVVDDIMKIYDGLKLLYPPPQHDTLVDFVSDDLDGELAIIFPPNPWAAYSGLYELYRNGGKKKHRKTKNLRKKQRKTRKTRKH